MAGGRRPFDTPAGILAFRRLAGQCGGPRAAWLATNLTPVRAEPDAPITVTPTHTRPDRAAATHPTVGLPSRSRCGRPGPAGRPGSSHGPLWTQIGSPRTARWPP